MRHPVRYPFATPPERKWYSKGGHHRAHGPAIESDDGSKHWYCNNIPHRDDGPAREWAGGRRAWIVHGRTTRYATANIEEVPAP